MTSFIFKASNGGKNAWKPWVIETALSPNFETKSKINEKLWEIR